MMTVNPGFGGQNFIDDVLEKIRVTRDICDKLKIDLDIQVDGGINPEKAKLCYEAGANVFVAGTYLFQFQNMQEGVHLLKNSLQMQ